MNGSGASGYDMVYPRCLGMRDELAKGHLDFLLLAGLKDKPLHGYALIEAIRLSSNETFDLPEGSVYPALHRLERAGLLESAWDKSGGRPRRLYRITRRGKAELRRQHVEWSRFTKAVTAVTGARA